MAQHAIERYWRDAGLVDVRTRAMSVGGGVVMSGTKDQTRAMPASADALRPAFYALRSGGWRDYWTLLHPPYTLWHLSYVMLGAALVPSPDPRVVVGALAAFGLAVGVAAHSFDELRGRPLGTRIPSRMLQVLGGLALLGSVVLGVVGAAVVGLHILPFVALGVALVLLYAFEAPFVHTDAGFALAWGAFPVIAAGAAVGAAPVAALVVAVAAALISLAQRRLSTRVRQIRRRAASASGVVVYRDGRREPIDLASLIAAPEAALRILWLAMAALGAGALLARWWS